ncbi:NACHT domain-containing protein [Leptolyngbyaceae cyanobacterium CCMR0082]|uniref:NACHT domain-containing protein n=1 Tax=Adonisia turfae CCMR0082 TaxID=2304604 RepID=A0A6M0S8S4_9CYAN|nr:NACHT domain-containing NTPase [Adonisia turfae]NEZ64371.1 NACHT domain-containing protein [Adonisia turfae CCMR0082]
MVNESHGFSIRPVIHYPSGVQAGKTYLMTIDLLPEESFKWHSEEEEHPIYCQVDSDVFNTNPVDETVVVLHRFGGSYGEIGILVTAPLQGIEGQLSVTLINRWGVPIKRIFLGTIPIYSGLVDSPIETEIHVTTSQVKPQNIESRDEVDELVEKIRTKISSDIYERCGTMRVLDMVQPIGINDIYIRVNILEKLSGSRQIDLNELPDISNQENFDRLPLGQNEIERVSGLEAVERYDKLMILSKPGAGKTMFMKKLAILCSRREFQNHRVPVFITLKEFSEAEEQPRLQDFIAKQWKVFCGVEDTKSLEVLLRKGHVLVLLDGLDEVQANHHNHVVHEIKVFTQTFRTCQFVITCRIAARKYTFEHFAEVEIADFSQEQIAEFSMKWFSTYQSPEKGHLFIKFLKKNPPVQELATNPIILTLLCLVFGESGDFPANRSELYSESLSILLKKWDAKRMIERGQVYKHLSLKRKEDLLGLLAFQTFERGDYFFNQNVAEQLIFDYIRQLPEAKDDQETLQLNSEAVLKSIEAQHGLLVERARRIYSFSHRTFQEYFVARRIVTCSTKQIHTELSNLVSRITQKRYREIFLLTVELLPDADELLLLMKKQIDSLISNSASLQALLSWVCKKAENTDTNGQYKPSVIRAFYLALSNMTFKDLINKLAPSLSVSLDSNALTSSPDYGDSSLSLNQGSNFEDTNNLKLDLELTQILAHASSHELARIELAHFSSLNEELQQELQTLNSQLPHSNEQNIQEWWDLSGNDWIKSLRSVMIYYRNIGHDWEFTADEIEQLHNYQNANMLLIDCLNCDCYVTRSTRQKLKETLLLPVAEIENPPVD